MTQPGWYPDQNGGSGKKYWDGQTWHDAVPAARVTAPPAVPIPPIAPPPARRSRKWIWWVVGPIAALIFVPMLLVLIPALLSKNSDHGSPTVVSQAEERRQTNFDYPLTITAPQYRVDGTSSQASQLVLVSSPAPVPAQDFLPLQGALYGSQVTVAADKGTVTVNPFFFSARTQNGTNLQSTITMGTNELPATELPQGQKVTGWLVFDVPQGQRIVEIILSDPLGAQLGRWTVS